MSKVLVVTSGKGGVGKTTSTAALGAALAQLGKTVVVVDFDVGLRNLDLVMGAERRVVFDLINVIQGDAKLPQALIRDKRIEGLSLLPASQTRDKDALSAEGVARVIAELREKFDWVICDSPAGIEKGATLAMHHADAAVVVVDFDVGLRNLDLVMGAERRVVFDLINVIQGDAKLPQALIRDKRIDTLSLLPASQTRDKDALTAEGVGKVIDELRMKFDWVICDSPAGIEKGATLAMHHADAAVVVTNPEVSSVRDSDRIIGMLDSKTAKAARGERIEKHLLLTRYDPMRAQRGEMLKVEDVLEILSIPLLGIIPESEEVLRASNLGSPVTLNAPQSGPGRAYFDAARRLMGETVPQIMPGEKRGLISKLFGRRVA